MRIEGQKSLLLVEDEAIIGMTEKAALEKYGYNVKTVTTGEKAVEAVKTSTGIDLILMDINLGDGIDGTEAAELILEDHDIPIVFVSSHSEREIVEKTEKITSYGYVVKNSSITVLDASIKMAFKLFDAKIAEQKKEVQLRENEEQYRLLHENAGVGIGYYSVDGIVLSYNNIAASHMNGVPAEFIGKSIYEIFPKADAELYHDRIKKAAASEGTIIFEDIVPLPSGNMYFLSTFARIATVDGDLYGVQIISQDITQRKNAEIAVQASETKYRLQFQNMKSYNSLYEVIRDKEGRPFDFRFVMVNKAYEDYVGKKSSDLIGKTLLEVYPETEQYWIDKMAEAVSSGSPLHFEAFSKEMNIHTEFSLFVPQTGYLSMVTENITERKNAEIALQEKNEEYEVLNEELQSTIEELQAASEELQAQNEELRLSQEMLRQSESQFSMFMDYLPAIVFLKGADGRTLFTNRYMDTVLGSSGWKGKKMTEVFPNAFGEQLLADDMSILRSGNRKIEEAISHFDGTIHTYETHKFQIKRPTGESLIGGFSIDITKRKKAEEAIETLLAEKELVLKEVHHRIRNNMNVLGSVLSLQAQTVDEASARIALEDAERRVQGMSLLYDKLYRSPDFTELSMKDFLPALIDEIIANFPGSQMVKVEKVIQDFVLGAKRLQMLGIIINELLTNIMKYAFQGRASGLISVTAIHSEGRVAISVLDNGNGIPESINFGNSTGFGLQLVHTLTQQLDGTIRIERGEGTKIVLEFNE